MFNEVADIAQSELVNSRTFKDLWNKIQGLSSTYPVFKDFQCLEFKIKKFKYFQGLLRMRGNPVCWMKKIPGVFQSNFRIFRVLLVIVHNGISNTLGL